MQQKILRLKGKVQHYSWGGYQFIPDLLKIKNESNLPFAEYWMGAHSSSSALLETSGGWQSWYELIQQSPDQYLGEELNKKFGGLPYLFKVLDVNEMLSIQVHPTKQEAQIGFEKEEAAGIPLEAPHRNFKDQNHKPEVMIALSEFWLLHGFKQQDELKQTLQQIPELNFLYEIFIEAGYRELYKTVMELPQEETDQLLLPLIKRELSTKSSRNEPGYWVSKSCKGSLPEKNIDKGIFSIYFFNIVELQKGQGIYQAAGVPHAYLEGQNVELMANSDNVLRGGLTTKHVDVDELMKHIAFEGIAPTPLSKTTTGAETTYFAPVEDFAISSVELGYNEAYHAEATTPEVYLVMEGKVTCGNVRSEKGDCFIILPNTSYAIESREQAMLYRASVPKKR